MFISGVFQTTRDRHFFFYFFFFRFKNIFQEKKNHYVFKTTMGYLWTEYAELIFHQVPLIYDFDRSL